MLLEERTGELRAQSRDRRHAQGLLGCDEKANSEGLVAAGWSSVANIPDARQALPEIIIPARLTIGAQYQGGCMQRKQRARHLWLARHYFGQLGQQSRVPCTKAD